MILSKTFQGTIEEQKPNQILLKNFRTVTISERIVTCERIRLEMTFEKAKFENFKIGFTTELAQNMVEYKSANQNLATRKFIEELEKKSNSQACTETLES